MPTPPGLDVWPIEIRTYLTMLEAFILKNDGFNVAWFEKYHVA